jgi:hypothetical protein
MSIVEAFKKTITFFDEMQKEGHITEKSQVPNILFC